MLLGSILQLHLLNVKYFETFYVDFPATVSMKSQYL